MSRTYKIPEFKMHELIKAVHHKTFTDTGSGLYCKCPVTSHKTPGRYGNFRVYPDNGKWGTYVCACDTGGTAWDFLEKHHGLPGWGAKDTADFDETILFICRALDIKPEPLGNATYTIKDRVRRLYRDLDQALEPVQFPEEHPHFQEGNYRGLPPMSWYSRGVGYLPESKVKGLFREHGKDVFEAAGLILGGWTYRWMSHGVAIMRYNEYGSPVGLAVRRYKCFGPDEEPKYFKDKGANVLIDTRSYLFNWQEVRQSKEPTIYVVEGEIDALACSMRGLTPVVTQGSGQLSYDQADRLIETGKRVVYIADCDQSGAGWRMASNMADRIDGMHYLFPVPGEGEYLDPDEYVQRYGAQALREAPTYTTRQIRMLAEGVDPETGRWTGDEKALAEKYMNEILGSPSSYDEDEVELLADLSGRDFDLLKGWLLEERSRQALQHLSGSSSISIQLT